MMGLDKKRVPLVLIAIILSCFVIAVYANAEKESDSITNNQKPLTDFQGNKKKTQDAKIENDLALLESEKYSMIKQKTNTNTNSVETEQLKSFVQNNQSLYKDEKTKSKQSANITQEQVSSQSSTTKVQGSNSFIYNEKIPLPLEHQKYLYNMCIQRNIDYKSALAVIDIESSFRANVISKTNDYGYFQINKVNHKRLTKTLGTKNQPLDPYININWGTYMLNELKNKYTQEGYKGEGLRNAILSAYKRGQYGFKKYGVDNNYVGKFVKSKITVDSWFD